MSNDVTCGTCGTEYVPSPEGGDHECSTKDLKVQIETLALAIVALTTCDHSGSHLTDGGQIGFEPSGITWCARCGAICREREASPAWERPTLVDDAAEMTE